VGRPPRTSSYRGAIRTAGLARGWLSYGEIITLGLLLQAFLELLTGELNRVRRAWSGEEWRSLLGSLRLVGRCPSVLEKILPGAKGQTISIPSQALQNMSSTRISRAESPLFGQIGIAPIPSESEASVTMPWTKRDPFTSRKNLISRPATGGSSRNAVSISIMSRISRSP
jgi:hypothetical protein